MKRVVVGCPIWNSAWVLDRWLNSVCKQRTSEYEIETAFVFSHSQDNTHKMLMDDPRVNWVITGPDSPRQINDHINHIWSPDYYRYMARVRNTLVKWAEHVEADYFFSLDSDILIPPGTVSALVDSMKKESCNAIAPLVNMSPAGCADKAWNYMFWQTKGEVGTREFQDTYKTVTHKVDIIMAAMFMDKKAMQCRWYYHDQGEDIGWSVDAYRRDLSIFIHKGIEATHLVKRG